jgi:hypothetical protein
MTHEALFISTWTTGPELASFTEAKEDPVAELRRQMEKLQSDIRTVMNKAVALEEPVQRRAEDIALDEFSRWNRQESAEGDDGVFDFEPSLDVEPTPLPTLSEALAQYPDGTSFELTLDDGTDPGTAVPDSASRFMDAFDRIIEEEVEESRKRRERELQP